MDTAKTAFIFLKYSIGEFFKGEIIHPDRYLTGDSKINIVILPGISTKDTQNMYGKLADAISDHGYKIYFVPRLGYNMKDIPTSAKITRSLIEERGLKNVVLFGHSKGGIIGKYILQHINQDGKVLNLIAISTPFKGTPVVNHLLYKRFNEFSPKSELIRNLEAYTKDNEKIYSLIPSRDSVIKNINNMKVNGGKNIYLKTEGHNKSVNSPESIELVLKILGEIEKKI